MQSEANRVTEPQRSIVIHVTLQCFFWMTYAAVFIQIWEISRLHRLTFGIVMLPILYPLPYATGVKFRRWLENARGGGLMTEGAANSCSNYLSQVLWIAYVLVFSFGLFGFWGHEILS